MVETFEVTPAAVSAVKINNRNFSFETIKVGFRNLGIPLTYYAELEDFKDSLENEDINPYRKYVCMLAKTIGTIHPELKERSELVISECLNLSTSRK